MSSNDVTKPNNHLFWLWLAYASLFGFVLVLHSMSDASISKAEKSNNETATYIQVELAQIKVKLAIVETQLLELNKSIKELAANRR